jgi:hypothetical protein
MAARSRSTAKSPAEEVKRQLDKMTRNTPARRKAVAKKAKGKKKASAKKKVSKTARRKKVAQASLDALKEHGAKKGEVRNPKGINGWTKARQRVKEVLEEHSEDLITALVALAEDGDIQALKTALGPLLPPQQAEVEHTGHISFSWSDEEVPE